MDRSFIETVEDTGETTEYEELQQQLNYYFSDREIARWFRENLPEKEWLQQIAINFTHELEGDENTDDDESEEPLTRIEKLRAKVNELAKDYTIQTERVEDLEKYNAEINHENRELDKMNAELLYENEELKTRIEELENDEMSQLEYAEWNRENPEIQALGRQIESLEQTTDSLRAERAKLIAYIKEQQEHIRVLGAQYEADNGKLATADWDSILRSDDTSSGEEKAATQQTEEHK